MNTSKFSSDIQAARVSKKLIGGTKDIILVNVYDSPETSSYKQKKKAQGTYVNTLDQLNAFLSTLHPESDFIILGDFNARTGALNSYSNSEGSVYQSLCNGNYHNKSHPIRETRVSKDNEVNERGKRLINFATEWNVSILNGCTVGDILGDWSCHLYNGNSVVDYLLLSESLHHSIRWFQVMDFNEFSDH